MVRVNFGRHDGCQQKRYVGVTGNLALSKEGLFVLSAATVRQIFMLYSQQLKHNPRRNLSNGWPRQGTVKRVRNAGISLTTAIWVRLDSFRSFNAS